MPPRWASIAYGVALVVAGAALGAYSVSRGPRSPVASNVIGGSAAEAPAGSSSTGKLFSGAKVNSYRGPVLFSRAFVLANETTTKTTAGPTTAAVQSSSCDKWAVVTTIFDPSPAIIDVVTKLSGVRGRLILYPP